MKVLVTGAAGFIGMHVCKKLLDKGHDVVGMDNVNDYYDAKLKFRRISQLLDLDNFNFIKVSVTSQSFFKEMFKRQNPEQVIHLAAEVGIRHSIKHPERYIDTNVVGFLNVLEACVDANVDHLLYASSSSVYGEKQDVDFPGPVMVSESCNTSKPLCPYAVTKKASELLAHSFSCMYQLKVTGMRFFTVYGPWGRPDMASWIFTKAILEGKEIEIFNQGHMARDFTYIDDVVQAITSLMHTPATGTVPAQIFNIGNSKPIRLMDFISIIEKITGKEAMKHFKPLQTGDVISTCADVSALYNAIAWIPNTSIVDGLSKFITWYKEYHKEEA